MPSFCHFYVFIFGKEAVKKNELVAFFGQLNMGKNEKENIVIIMMAPGTSHSGCDGYKWMYMERGMRL